MINATVNRQNVYDALAFIDTNGVPSKRRSKKYDLNEDGRLYPPKYVLSIATRFATGRELPSLEFSAGHPTNSFLISLGFVIRERNENA
jgi:hypothetical protein